MSNAPLHQMVFWAGVVLTEKWRIKILRTQFYQCRCKPCLLFSVGTNWNSLFEKSGPETWENNKKDRVHHTTLLGTGNREIVSLKWKYLSHRFDINDIYHWPQILSTTIGPIFHHMNYSENNPSLKVWAPIITLDQKTIFITLYG